jgi:peptidoglycan/LPS O-acetylase OafA/YrhL
MKAMTSPESAASRRPAIDVARILALVLVVAGHLLMAVVDRSDGEMRGENLIELQPFWTWVAVLAPMPVFFAAGGWANATGTLRTSASRLSSLVGAASVVVVAWTVGVALTWAVAGESDLIGRGARVATQPLWFLAAYVPLTAGGVRLARLAARHVVVLVAVAFVGLAVVDALRFSLDAPTALGWTAFLVAWGVPWVLGGWWRDRSERGAIRERRAGAALATGAVAGGIGLVLLAGYSPELIDVTEGARSNTTPPTLYTAVAGIAQVGVLMMLAGPLDRLGRRWRTVWDRAGTLAVGVYLWHLTALALCVGVVALGLPTPRRLTAGWWATRPLWWASVLGVTAGLTLATAAGHRWLRARARPRPAAMTTRLALGIAAATAGAALVGLRGPRTPVLGLACSTLLVVGWWLLRVRRDDVR